MKLDIHTLAERGLSWEMMQEIDKFEFKRAVAPEDALNFNMNTIDVRLMLAKNWLILQSMEDS